MSPQDVVVCFYCKTYNSIISDYPVNSAIFDQLEDDTPRCEIHAQFECHHCLSKTHFNGISYCEDCSEFTCLNCGLTTIEEIEFLFYSYYYKIMCQTCNKINSALDYGEYSLQHPFQTGALRPNSAITLWVPLGNTHKSNTKVGTGSNRLLRYSQLNKIKRVENAQGLATKSWEKNTDNWIESRLKGDAHHEAVIIPELLKLANVTSDMTVVDLGCGTGPVSRIIAPQVKHVIGIDITLAFLEFARKKDAEDKFGIEYIHSAAENINEFIEMDSVDLVICNMVLMDLDSIHKTIENVKLILKPGGHFVFSITHPCFSWPATNTLRLPKDSQRNEDKMSVVMDYYDTRAVTFVLGNMSPVIVQFPRTMSFYVNLLSDNGFTIIKMEEPQVSDELAMKHPRDFYNDLTKKPNFLLMSSKKE